MAMYLKFSTLVLHLCLSFVDSFGSLSLNLYLMFSVVLNLIFCEVLYLMFCVVLYLSTSVLLAGGFHTWCVAGEETDGETGKCERSAAQQNTRHHPPSACSCT